MFEMFAFLSEIIAGIKLIENSLMWTAESRAENYTFSRPVGDEHGQVCGMGTANVVRL